MIVSDLLTIVLESLYNCVVCGLWWVAGFVLFGFCGCWCFVCLFGCLGLLDFGVLVDLQL